MPASNALPCAARSSEVSLARNPSDHSSSFVPNWTIVSSNSMSASRLSACSDCLFQDTQFSQNSKSLLTLYVIGLGLQPLIKRHAGVPIDFSIFRVDLLMQQRRQA